MSYNTIQNGWTKATMKAAIRKYNNGTPAVDYNDEGVYSCEYKAKDGNRCAVGCFIPDGHEALQSGEPASSLAADYPDLEKVLPILDADLINSFQLTHDRCRESDADLHKTLDNWIDDALEDPK